MSDKPILYKCRCGWWSEDKRFDLKFHRATHQCAKAGTMKHGPGGDTFIPYNVVDNLTDTDL